MNVDKEDNIQQGYGCFLQNTTDNSNDAGLKVKIDPCFASHLGIMNST